MMSLKTKRNSVALIALTCVAVILFFQNCGQVYNIKEIEQKAEDANPDPNAQGATPQYAAIPLSLKTPPPLKLVFVVDNSNSMTLNNLNLKKSISVMFDKESKNIAEFDSDIYFISTSQLSPLANSFLPQLKAPEELVNQTLSSLLSANRGSDWISGKIAGDLLGFKLSKTSQSDLQSTKILPQPVVEFSQGSGADLQVSNSIHFQKGSSIDDLKAAIAERLDVLSPEKASNSEEASLYTALDTESALCAVGRVLKNPDGILKTGDLASFIIVSDENESNPSGSQCVDEIRTENLYNVNCQQVIPAGKKDLIKFKYQTMPGAAFQRSTLNVTKQDVVKNKRVSNFTLNRAAVNATCIGEYQKDFKVSYTVNRPQYNIQYSKQAVTSTTPAVNSACNATYQKDFEVRWKLVTSQYEIKYSKWALIGEREGGVKVYSQDPTANNVSLIVAGTMPADCQTNVALVANKISDSTSKIKVNSCAQLADTSTDKTQTLAFANYPTVTSPSATCPDAVKSAVMAGVTNGSVGTCAIQNVVVSIPLTLLTAKGWSTQGTVATCQSAVSQVCSSSSGAYKACAYVSGTDYVASVTNYSSNWASVSGGKTVVGNLPSNCVDNSDNGIQNLRNLIGDTTSKLRIDSCAVAQNQVTSKEATYSYSSYPTVTVPGGSCPSVIVTQLTSTVAGQLDNGVPGQFGTCTTANATAVAIPSASITSSGWNTSSTSVVCGTAITKVCSDSAGSLRYCVVKSSSDFVAGDAGRTVSKTDTVDYSCSSKCNQVAGACNDNTSTDSISTFATSVNLKCSVSNANSSETYLVAQSPEAPIVIDNTNAVTCQNTCAQFPQACGGKTDAVALSSYYKACSASSVLMSGSAAMNVDLNSTPVENPQKSLSCTSLCLDAGVCTGLAASAASTTTVNQFIASKNGQNCSVELSVEDVAQKIVPVTVPKISRDMADQRSCPAGYTFVSKAMTSDTTTKTNLVSGSADLSSYIEQRLNQLIGSKSSSFSAFITPEGQGSTQKATSFGQIYKALVEKLNRGTLNDIRLPSYEAALSNLGEILRSQLVRSIQFQQVGSNQKIYKVWKRSDSVSDWGQPLADDLWSSSGGTVTLDERVDLGISDEIKIEYY